ncbi:transporter substrate-binding domain-containing protein [Microbulbifer sp. SSSA008]|uniref:transporter substrate-binding domain-containing protein n=1 Tax=Microbulbifer sp. SSSA008 TaxID=3243380 RepID=UPI00403994B8
MSRKRFFVIFPLFVLILLLAACESNRDPVVENSKVLTESPQQPIPTPQNKQPAKPQFENYVEQGDLPALLERGVLRLLAPRGPQESALPREGLPATEWRKLAENFARSRGLKPQWVYVDNFSDLIPAVIDGRGDVIATNFSRTEERKLSLGFTRPLQYVDELLITHKEFEVEEAVPLQVVLRRGSAFAETLEQQVDRENYRITYLDKPVATSELIGAVAAGEYPATIIDSNLADVLLTDYPQLTATTELDSRRPIAWAVRKGAIALRRELNEFFTAELVLASQNREQPLRDWQAIKESGTLRVLTRNHPASYFIWRGELMGFDYDLLRKFARDHKLRLSMVVPDKDQDLVEALNDGMGDMIAASLTVTEARRQQGLAFSKPYMTVTEQVVAAKSKVPDKELPLPENLLSGQTVVVNPTTSYHESLVKIMEKQHGQDMVPLQIHRLKGATSEFLIDAVARGIFPYTVVDSHLAAIESTYRDDFTVVGELPGERDIAWAVRTGQPVLLEQLNNFLNKHNRDLFFNVTYNKYFKEQKRILRHQGQRLRSTDELSPFDPIVKKYTEATDRDWRMVVAQMYQESQFNPQALSFAGAQGLMQVLPRTARQMGVKNLYDPENGIRAGVSYLGWLDKRFPENIPLEQKIYFTLAAYNAGHGHVRDARALARRLEWDPNQWFGHVEEAMLLLSQPEYYRDSRFGYVRGREPVNYVREIRDRYIGYLGVERHQNYTDIDGSIAPD